MPTQLRRDPLVDVEAARQQIRYQLNGYKRLSLETGAFWSTLDGQRIKRENRADKRLLRSMDQVRRRLSDLPNDQAYALLGRSIFVRYLVSIAAKKSPKVPLKKSPGWGNLRWHFRVPV